MVILLENIIFQNPININVNIHLLRISFQSKLLVQNDTSFYHPGGWRSRESFTVLRVMSCQSYLKNNGKIKLRLSVESKKIKFEKKSRYVYILLSKIRVARTTTADKLISSRSRTDTVIKFSANDIENQNFRIKLISFIELR